MTLRFRALFVWLLVIVLAGFLVCAAGLKSVRGAWQEWLVNQSIESLEWQGLEVSWSGLDVAGFTLVRIEGGQPLTLQGSGLRLGWRWSHPALTGVRIERLELVIPAWPAPSPSDTREPVSWLPASVPDWVPQQISIAELHVSLPDAMDILGDLSLFLAADPELWQLHTESLDITANLTEFQSAGWRARDIRGRVKISGWAGVNSAQLELLAESEVTAVTVESPGNPDLPALDRVSADLAGLQLRAGYTLDRHALQTLKMTGPVRLASQALHHSALKTLGWEFQGTVAGSLDSATVNGRLTGTSGLAADLSLGWSGSGKSWLDGRLQLSGKQAGNILAATLGPWPETVQLESGTLTLGGRLYWSGDDLLADARLALEDLSGIMDRTAWSGLSGQLDVSYGEHLIARTWDMQLESLNPGMDIGPVTLSASYEAPAAEVGSGIFTLIEGRAGLFGGEVWIRPGEWPVAQRPVQLLVELNDVQLEKLLEAYPAEGVAANGVLEGQLPVQLDDKGVQVTGGSIRALAPGGMLQLPAGQLQAMMGSSVEVTPVVQALQNFNYTALASTIDYDLNGKLVMGLSVQGRNPEVQNGRPIVLNIQLEEDIPALLTSLQLSGRVNEAVTEKVRKMMDQGTSGLSGH